MSSTATARDRFADYVPVSERLEHFYKDHPEGRVLTSIVEHNAENGFVLIRAEIYRERDDATPSATGHAFENRSEGYVNKTSYIENCETSATGRALALLGYEIRRGIASREEMEKAERMGTMVAEGTPARDFSEPVPDCPECGGQMWDNRSTKKGNQPDFKCKDRSCNKAAWLPKEPVTEGYSQDQVLRDQFFAQAEKIMKAGGMEEGKRKEALGRLLMLSTEDMGKRVNELAENARKKNQEPRSIHDEERQLKLGDIKRDADPEKLEDYLINHFPGLTLDQLDFDAVTQVHEEFSIPF